MYHPRQQHSSMTTSMSSSNNGRRAFRDVTNKTRGADDHKAMMNLKPTVVAKRSANMNIHVPSAAPANTVRAQAMVLESRDPPAESSRGVNMVSSSGFNSYQYVGQVDNIDERDSDDPLCVTSYVADMYAHFRGKESLTSVRPVYMEQNQSQINERMRSILVDWLVEVHLKFKLVPETLYLTVNLIDRFLERQPNVSRPKLQLVGVTCLLIASKYEEIYPPELRDLVYICDKAYTRTEIIACEEQILKTLEYNVTIPSAHAFLVRDLKAAHADKKIVQLACYVLDGTLTSYALLHYLPSQLAAAAVFIARRTVGRNSWSPTLLKYAEYCEEEVVPVARAVLAEKSSQSQELRAVTKKYSSSRYGSVANTVLHCDF